MRVVAIGKERQTHEIKVSDRRFDKKILYSVGKTSRSEISLK